MITYADVIDKKHDVDDESDDHREKGEELVEPPLVFAQVWLGLGLHPWRQLAIGTTRCLRDVLCLGRVGSRACLLCLPGWRQ